VQRQHKQQIHRSQSERGPSAHPLRDKAHAGGDHDGTRERREQQMPWHPGWNKARDEIEREKVIDAEYHAGNP
jgi:hypothetical protein